MRPDNAYRNRVLALAAVFQAAALADALAWGTTVDADSRKVLLDSLLRIDSDDPAVRYGTIAGMTDGLRTLEESLVMGAAPGKDRMRRDSRQADRLRYALGLIQIERKLAGNPEMLTTTRKRLEQAKVQMPHFADGMTGTGMTHKLAGIYIDTLGTFPQRIQIRGSEQRLRTSGVPEQIRAVLLAGVQSAALWHRLGGRRWHLLFTRGRILRELRQIILDSRR